MGRTESPNLKNDYERACGWYGHFNQSEMALFFECTDRYPQKLLDTADIVREAMLHPSTRVEAVAASTSCVEYRFTNELEYLRDAIPAMHPHQQRSYRAMVRC